MFPIHFSRKGERDEFPSGIISMHSTFHPALLNLPASQAQLPSLRIPLSNSSPRAMRTARFIVITPLLDV